MSNFQFLTSEFKNLFEPAKGAEQLMYSDPRACCMRTCHALEQLVHWLYEHDRDANAIVAVIAAIKRSAAA
ncbi:MAG TPA: hypothetical protein VFF22_00685 [Pseudomonas sp.]|nr:hypothetical protein [Pseudomonas sp.]